MSQTERLDTQPATGDAAFRSILFADGAEVGGPGEPAFFRDLNLDQVVDAVVAGRDEYELRPFFHAPLRDADAVEYRHEVFRELERGEVRAAVRAFAEEAQRVRRFLRLAAKQRYELEKQRWFLDAALRYCDAVAALLDALDRLEPRSRGFRGLRDHLAAYAATAGFRSLAADARAVLEGLNGVRYTTRIKGGRVTVSTYEGERDYGAEIEETFARFRQGDVESHLLRVPDSGSMDHVEARIAQLVARLFPRDFQALDAFCARHREFLDPVVARFDREVQFCLAWLEHTERLAPAGASFCYPAVSTDSKEVSASGAFDVALAAKLAEEQRIVRNDFVLRGPERILVVTGPNQGGKTTFARAFGQLHHLAALGVPVPARAARLFLPDGIFTHFEREEDIATLRGKLDDELVRVREILEHATGDSVVVLNEIFSSTTLDDAVQLGTEILNRLVELGCLGVCVTFVDELASLGPATVSMVAGVEPADPSRRTFEIARRPADGRAYAWAIADKYGLSHERLRKRIGG